MIVMVSVFPDVKQTYGFHRKTISFSIDRSNMEEQKEYQTEEDDPTSGGGGKKKIQTDAAADTYLLGDIVYISAPRNAAFHQQLFYISYVDAYKIKLLQSGSDVVELKRTADGGLFDESIQHIHVVSRSAERGFARQHGLLPDTYVDLEFNGDLPQFVTGKIVNLVHDMIQIETIPDKTVLFIDFAYQGIPEHIPLRKIRIRDGPPKITNHQGDEDDKDGVSQHGKNTFVDDTSNTGAVNWNDEGEMVVTGIEDDTTSRSFHVLLEEQYVEADRLMQPTHLEKTFAPETASFTEDLLIANSTFDACERLRILQSAIKDNEKETKPLSWWIPIFSEQENSISSSSDTDGIVIQKQDAVVISFKRGHIKNAISYALLPKMTVRSPCDTNLLEEMLQPTLLHWKLFSGELPPMVDISASAIRNEWFKNTGTTMYVVPAAAAAAAANSFWTREPLAKETLLPKYRPQKRAADSAATSSGTTWTSSLFEENATLLKQFLQSYSFLPKNATESSEMLNAVLRTDGAAFLAILIRSMVMPTLTLSPDMTNSITETMQKKINDYEDMNHVGTVKASAACARRVLAKRYTSLGDIHKDSLHHGGGSKSNNSSDHLIFFDTEYDDTPYDLLKPMEQEFGETTAKPEDFKEFIIHTLIDRHNYIPKKAEEVALHLVMKKRPVQEGHYALLDTTKDQFYYRRTRDQKWILDKTVDPQAFVDTTTLFCNVDKICMRDAASPTCETPEDAQKRLRYLEQRRVLRELQTRLTESAYQTAEVLEKEANRVKKLLSRRKILDYVEQHRYDEFHGALGARRNNDDPEIRIGTTASPYIGLRNRILGDRDAVRKEKRIRDFVVRHCREALEGESPYWWYCNESVPACPLIPTSLLREGGVLLDQAVEEDDVWVDKHTGYTLGALPLTPTPSASPVAVEEEDALSSIVVKDEIREIAHLLYLRLGLLANIRDDDPIMMSTLRVAQDLMQKIPTSEQYQKLVAPRDATQTPFLPYSIFKDREYILRISCAMLFSVQTSRIPSPEKTRRHLRVLASGYPLLNDENELGGIAILAHLLHKLKSQKRLPWDCLQPWNELTIRHALVTRCRNLLVGKTKYARLLDVERHRAMRALPPCVSTVPTLPPLLHSDGGYKSSFIWRSKQFAPMEDGFEAHLTALMTQGNKSQHAFLNTLKCKNWIYSLAILEASVASSSSLIPKWMDMGRSWQTVVENVRVKSRAQVLAIASSAAVVATDDDVVIGEYRDRTAWNALLHYHNLDHPGPIPDSMRALGLVREKPADYDSRAILDEKKQALGDVKLDSNKFKTMMNVVFQRNVVGIPQPKNLHQKQVSALRDLLASFSTRRNTILTTILCQLLDAHLSTGSKDDESTTMALMEELTVQRLALWTQMKQWFARDQIHRIQNILSHDDDDDATSRTSVPRLIRNLTRIYPRVYSCDISEIRDLLKDSMEKECADLATFVDLVTSHIMEKSLVDAIHAHTLLVVLRAYIEIAKTNHAMRDYMANLVSDWIQR